MIKIMGKISKYSNLYDRNGKLIRSIDSVSGRLEPYSIEELEKLVDELAKDETKRTEYTNSMSVLMRMYDTKGNPHKNDIIQKINDYAKSKTKTTKAEVINALNDIKDEEARENEPGTEGCVSELTEGDGESRGGSESNEADTTISTAA